MECMCIVNKRDFMSIIFSLSVRRLGRFIVKNRRLCFAASAGLTLFVIVLCYINFAIGYYASEPMQNFQYSQDIDLFSVINAARDQRQPDIGVKPINDPNYKYIMLNKGFCSEPLDILFLVKTTHDRVQSRNVIRETWGNKNCVSTHRIRTTFLLGRRKDLPGMEAALRDEFRSYGDIVQQDFGDSYYNNTYKMMMGFDFAVRFCSSAKYIVFIDDDYFVNPWQLTELTQTVHGSLYPRYLGGYVWYAALPKRSWFNKWFVSVDEYPFRYFPDYAAAGTLVISSPLARDLHAAIKYTKYNAFDDVFIGIILFKLHLAPVHIREIYSSRPDKMTQLVISSHGFTDPKDILESWINLGLDGMCKLNIKKMKRRLHLHDRQRQQQQQRLI